MVCVDDDDEDDVDNVRLTSKSVSSCEALFNRDIIAAMGGL